MDDNIKFDLQAMTNQILNYKINNAIASMSPDQKVGIMTAKMLKVLNKYGIDSLKGLSMIKELMECCMDDEEAE